MTNLGFEAVMLSRLLASITKFHYFKEYFTNNCKKKKPTRFLTALISFDCWYKCFSDRIILLLFNKIISEY